jgi:phosphopantetheine adenylyltransferase
MFSLEDRKHSLRKHSKTNQNFGSYLSRLTIDLCHQMPISFFEDRNPADFEFEKAIATLTEGFHILKPCFYHCRYFYITSSIVRDVIRNGEYEMLVPHAESEIV